MTLHTEKVRSGSLQGAGLPGVSDIRYIFRAYNAKDSAELIPGSAKGVRDGGTRFTQFTCHIRLLPALYDAFRQDVALLVCEFFQRPGQQVDLFPICFLFDQEEKGIHRALIRQDLPVSRIDIVGDFLVVSPQGIPVVRDPVLPFYVDADLPGLVHEILDREDMLFAHRIRFHIVSADIDREYGRLGVFPVMAVAALEDSDLDAAAHALGCDHGASGCHDHGC